MKLNINDRKKCGIYCIRNIINNKVYIGKSINIYFRIKGHITSLNTKNINENCHLINAWHKYGKDNFEYFVIEYLELDEKLIAERELYWMNVYNALDSKKGYNLRLDSSTGLIIKEETREKYRLAGIKRNSDPKEREKVSVFFKQFWKNNPDKKKSMSEKVSQLTRKYIFYQYDKNDVFIKVWDSVIDIIKENPSYKRHNIYAVCSGEKPTMYGYKWKKELKR